MKFALSILFYVLMTVLIGKGILMAVHGSFWLLIAGIVAYFVMLIRHGCATH